MYVSVLARCMRTLRINPHPRHELSHEGRRDTGLVQRAYVTVGRSGCAFTPQHIHTQQQPDHATYSTAKRASPSPSPAPSASRQSDPFAEPQTWSKCKLVAGAPASPGCSDPDTLNLCTRNAKRWRWRKSLGPLRTLHFGSA